MRSSLVPRVAWTLLLAVYVGHSGLALGNVGLWRIVMTIPHRTPAGSAVLIRVVINWTPSNTVRVAVR